MVKQSKKLKLIPQSETQGAKIALKFSVKAKEKRRNPLKRSTRTDVQSQDIPLYQYRLHMSQMH
ncbi:MAG: hypothetical protein AAF985_19430 [Bacteroidota bacterium]